MKRFFKTIAGKTILFCTFVLSVCVLIASVWGVLVISDMGFYSESADDTLYRMVSDKAHDDGRNIAAHFIEKMEYTPDTNLLYEVVDPNGNVVMTNNYGYSETENFSFTDYFEIEENGGYRYHYAKTIDNINSELYSLKLEFKKGFPENDGYSILYSLNRLLHGIKYVIYVIILLMLFLAIASFVILMSVSARRPDCNGIFAGPICTIPFDLLVVSIVIIGILCIAVFDWIFYYDFLVNLLVFIGIPALASILLGLCMTISARVKQGIFLKHNVISYILKGIFTLIRNIPILWRTVTLILLISGLEFFVIVNAWWEPDILLVFWMIEKIILIPLCMYVALMLRRLQKGGKALAEGELDYRTKTRGMIWEFKRHGENLNSIAGGMKLAISKELKSERLKTELITNVSHDIKTPLTSIINYTALIENEPCENEKIKEYTSVLTRQSERLKKLIEDLVEASKASTGNVEIELCKCDASVFLTQASGEYSERLEESGLTLITKQPDTPIMIMADGRRMLRVFDNLLSNIVKYAQSGTRVYMNLETDGKNAVISFKNTSREPLDISESELTERFVRGDRARNTEGNGLGLSIAKSLTELQGGTLDIDIDGDFFKVTLTFPTV